MASSTQPFGNVLDWKTLGNIANTGMGFRGKGNNRLNLNQDQSLYVDSALPKTRAKELNHRVFIDHVGEVCVASLLEVKNAMNQLKRHAEIRYEVAPNPL
jgi:hypothetical protein